MSFAYFRCVSVSPPSQPPVVQTESSLWFDPLWPLQCGISWDVRGWLAVHCSLSLLLVAAEDPCLSVWIPIKVAASSFGRHAWHAFALHMAHLDETVGQPCEDYAPRHVLSPTQWEWEVQRRNGSDSLRGSDGGRGQASSSTMRTHGSQ